MTIKINQLENKPVVLDVGSDPTIGAGQGSFYPKLVSGKAEGFYKDDQGNAVQLTSNGAVNAVGSGEINTASNLGIGTGLFASKSGVTLQFKSLVAGTNVTLSQDGTTVTINATAGSGEVNTASNLGASGEGVFASKVGVDLQFKKLIAGSNITLSSNSTSITIDATGGGTSSLQLRRVTTTNTNDVQIYAYGTTTDINNITVVKTNNNVTFSTIASGVKIISLQAYFSGTDIGANTSISISFPEVNGATTLEESLLPVMMRYQTNFNPFGTNAGSIVNSSGVITATHQGSIVANNPASLKLLF